MAIDFYFFYAGGHGYLIGNHYWLCCVGYAHVSKKLMKMETQVKSIEVDFSIHILQLTSSSFLKWLAKNRPQEANAEFAAWKLWVGVNCTWLYIGSQDAWAVFIIYLFFRLPYALILLSMILCTCCLISQLFNIIFFYLTDMFYVLIFFNIFLDSKYGSVRLGPEGSTPEYNDASWYFLNEQIWSCENVLLNLTLCHH